MRTENCGTCWFWEASKRPQEGTCHKGPPALVVLGRDAATAAFPPTPFNEWCGEHRPHPPVSPTASERSGP